MSENRFSKELLIALVSLVGIALYLIFYFLFPTVSYLNSPLYAVLLLGGIPLVFDLTKKLLKREFSSNLLAGISIVTAVILGEYLAGSLVVLML